MQRSSTREYAEAVRPRYRRADRAAKGRILDEFCAATGYHRVYARRLLGGRATAAVGAARALAPRPRRYGAEALNLLVACWEVADGVCSKRLAPFLGELLERLAACDALPPQATPELRAQVAGLSAATIDRLLAPLRTGRGPHGRGTTKPGTLLKGQVPIKTFADWDAAEPGFLEIDLVAHCGPTGAGEFVLTLSAVDVATGWSMCVAVRNKGQDAICRAIEQLRQSLPVPLRGLDSDNGSEFLNHSLLRYCAEQRITFTRSRPYRKNDTCHVEQKNWSVVRRLVGYARFEWPALGALERVYSLAADYVNFLQPVLKLADKTRDGPRVRKRYDTARTPYRRLLASGVLSAEQAAALAARSAALHPVLLKLAIEEAQQHLASLAVREYSPVRQRKSLEKIF